MRVLEVNNFFHARAGAEVVFFNTIDGLKQRGHDVAEFSTRQKDNTHSDYAAYFAPDVPEFAPRQKFSSFLRSFANLFYSKEVAKKLHTLVLAAEPQVAHLHDVARQLSASLFLTLKKLDLPIVYTVHDVQPMCPNHKMLHNHSVCEECLGHKYYKCAKNKCVNDSFLQSLACSLEAYFYQLRGIWKYVDAFICPSQFMLDKMIQWGFPAKKMRLIRNPYRLPEEIMPMGGKVVCMGRVHEEKGVRIFAEAIKLLRNYQVIIAGTGPDEETIDRLIRQYGLNNTERIGWVGEQRWHELLGEAKVMVFPSLSYENCSMGILESLSNGRIVVATNRGGNRELVMHKKTGFLAEPENSESLAQNIKEAMGLNVMEAQDIVSNGRELVRVNHCPEYYFKLLEEIYEDVCH